MKRTDFRKSLKADDWQSYGKLDYCPRCVKKGRHRQKESVFSTI